MSNNIQLSLQTGDGFRMGEKQIILKNIIIDRGSKYSVVGISLESVEQIKKEMQSLLQDVYFQKATHNSYAYRIIGENGSVIEGKNDDGETGAGMCILRELRREEVVNMMLIVTRYFGGVKLQADRFKHVIDACKIFFEKNKK